MPSSGSNVNRKRKRTETGNCTENEQAQKRIRNPEPLLMDLSFESFNGDESEDKNNDKEPITLAPSLEIDESEVVDIVTTVKKRNKFKWAIDSEWNNLDEALDFLEENGFKCFDNIFIKI